MELKIDLLPQEKSRWPVDPWLVLMPAWGVLSALGVFAWFNL